MSNVGYNKNGEPWGQLPEAPRMGPVLTVIPGRAPVTKMHSQKGQGKSAFNGYNSGLLYAWDETTREYVLEFEIPEPHYEPHTSTYGRTSYRPVENRPWKDGADLRNCLIWPDGVKP